MTDVVMNWPSSPPSLQSLPPVLARLCLRVRRFLQHDLAVNTEGRILLLAVSGGADSLAMLTILSLLRPHLGHSLRVAHLDHGLRVQSLLEAQMVERICADWGIPCTVHRTDVIAFSQSRRLGLEEAGREARYAMLEAERQRHGAAWVCTGHHAGDLEEDVLLRLLRGSGWPALGGMRALDAQRHLLRPLLLTSPDSLKELLSHCNIVWAEDASNAELCYKRNRLRHTLLPRLREESPGLRRHIQNLWRMAADDTAHWEALLDKLCASHNVQVHEDSVTLSRELLLSCDRATRLRLHIRALRLLGQGQGRAETLFQLDAAWEEKKSGGRFLLPGGITGKLQEGRVVFQRNRLGDK